MKIKVIYTGDPAETKVVDADTGEPVLGITDVQINIEPFSAYAVLVFTDFEAEIENIPADILHEKTGETE